MRIGIPRHQEEEIEEVRVDYRGPSPDTIWKIFDAKGWKCKVCNATMCSTMQYCAYCRFKLGKDTRREV